ncbi:MAG TPA: HAMP domain-containing sensor histidine kinase [Chthoniobacteraceae bacterium]|jgi:signal transduction histidine kinase|nr:HAMP domain-containing sensor histidine kinase [Chthoniobacteraceae bacterium]
MPSARPSRLWLSIAWPFFLFVVAGSTVLMLWMERAATRESRAVFTTLARTNADFLRNAHLPATEQMMGYLGRMLNLHAYLRDGATLLPDPGNGALRGDLSRLTAAGGVTSWGKNEAVAMPVRSGLDLLLVRPAEPAYLFLWRPETAAILGIFWLLSIGLAWSISRGVVLPIRQLAGRLPHIEDDPAATLPGAERRDELGDLARAYLAARGQIATEREKRRQAERMALLGRMATSLAHEIHNPLSAIRMHAQLLQSAPGEVAATVPVLIHETGRIESLVNQWMFLTKPEPPSTSPTELAPLIAEGVHAQSAAAAHAGVRIETQVPGGLNVNGDRRRLAQAIANTIVNAIQAMPRGGTLRIGAGKNGAGIALTFQDSGPGFSPQALERYRELFYSEKEGGMGIGLSVTAEILEAHGGGIEVRNNEQGGRVTFHLPSL